MQADSRITLGRYDIFNNNTCMVI